MDDVSNLPQLHIRRGKPPLEVGTYGKILARRVGDIWIASANARDSDGRTRRVQRQGASKDAAISALVAAIAARPGFEEERVQRLAEAAKRQRTTAAPFKKMNADKPHVVYRFFDAEGVLLYVGISVGALGRMSQHRRSARWWPRVARCEFVHYQDEESAREAERVAIRDEGPLFNIAS